MFALVLPTCHWHVGLKWVRIHDSSLTNKNPPAMLVGFYWWGKNSGFEPTQIQHAGGMLAKPVRTLVFSLPLSLGKRAIESTFPRTAPPATLVVFLWKNVVDSNPLKPVQPLVLPGLSYGRLPKPVFSAHFRRRLRYCSFISGV